MSNKISNFALCFLRFGVLIFSIGFFSFLFANNADAAWLSGWDYRKNITITGQSGAGTDFQIKLLVGESSGSSGANFNLGGNSADFPAGKNDGGDLSFTDNDGSSSLPFWVESVSGTTPNRTATIWVKVADNLNSNQAIYCYYGKSSATNLSNGTNAFLLFDDFNSGSLDTDLWTNAKSGTASTSLSAVNSQITLTNNSVSNYNWIYSKSSFTYPVWMETKADSFNSNGATYRMGGTIGTTPRGDNGNMYNAYAGDALGTEYRIVGDDSSGGWGTASTSLGGATSGIWSFAWNTNSQKFSVNYSSKLTSTDSRATVANYHMYLGNASNPSAGGSSIVDWARVRKYAATEPSFSSATAEETEDTTPPAVTFDPLNGASDVAQGSNITITFNEAVRNTDDSVLTDGNVDSLITLKDTNASGTDIPFDATINAGKTVITIIPTSEFSSEQVVYVAIGATVEDSQDNVISASSATFTMTEFILPTISELSPVNGADNVSLNSNLTITFSEIVDAQSGYITLYKSDNTQIEQFDVTSDISGSGTDEITINPTSDLDYETSYYVKIDATAFDDSDSNSFAGILDSSTWAFTTADEPNSVEDDDEDLDISNVEYSSDSDFITIKWETNNKADSKVKYGKNRDDLSNSKSENNREKKHKIVIKKLDPDTRYYFKIYSEDENGSEDKTKIYDTKTDKEKTIVEIIREFFQSSNENANAEGETQDEDENDSIIKKREYLPFEKVMEEKEEIPKPELEKSIISRIFKKEEKTILAEVKFRILDDSGNPISGLPVAIHSEVQNGVTDVNGVVAFENVETGSHTLDFSYRDQNFSKKVAIANPRVEAEEVSVEVIEIVAKKDPLPSWVFGLISSLGILLIIFIALYWKNQKKLETLR